jgi:hypothetical protein
VILADAAKLLDGYGVTLVNLRDPVSPSIFVPALDWHQCIQLIEAVKAECNGDG